MKSSVWPPPNHRFHLSSFAAKCPEKWSQGTLLWNTLATKIRKMLPRNTPTNHWKITCENTYKFMKKEYFRGGFRGIFFKFFRTWTPLGHQSPNKYAKITKRSPKGARKPKKGHRNSTQKWSVLANAIQLNLIFRPSFSRNPARRNARSALNNLSSMTKCMDHFNEKCLSKVGSFKILQQTRPDGNQKSFERGT